LARNIRYSGLCSTATNPKISRRLIAKAEATIIHALDFQLLPNKGFHPESNRINSTALIAPEQT
jgi:hypothetical protein